MILIRLSVWMCMNDESLKHLHDLDMTQCLNVNEWWVIKHLNDLDLTECLNVNEWCIIKTLTWSGSDSVSESLFWSSVPSKAASLIMSIIFECFLPNRANKLQQKEWVNDCCSTPTQQFQLYYHKNKLIFNEMMMRSTLY